MNVRDHASAGDGGFDEAVELLVSSDGQLQMARSDTLHAQILGGVTGQLEHLGTAGLLVSGPGCRGQHGRWPEGALSARDTVVQTVHSTRHKN